MADLRPCGDWLYHGDLGVNAHRATLTNDPFFAKRDGVYLILAFILAIITLRLPMEFWQRYSATMLLGSIILLMIVLVVGSSVKGHRVGSISVCCVSSLRS